MPTDLQVLGAVPATPMGLSHMRACHAGVSYLYSKASERRDWQAVKHPRPTQLQALLACPTFCRCALLSACVPLRYGLSRSLPLVKYGPLEQGAECQAVCECLERVECLMRRCRDAYPGCL